VVIEVVVLDVDDTLYLERDYVRSGFRAVGRHAEQKHDVVGLEALAWGEFEAGRRGDIFDRALRTLGVGPDAALVRSLVEVYREHEPAIAMLPDAIELVDRAHSQGLRLAVVTDGPVASQRAKVGALRLWEVAAPVVITAELGPGAGKPSPRAFELIERELGARRGALAYLADNPAKDFRAPAALGWHTFRVRRPGGLHEHAPSGSDVGVEVDSLDGVADRLLEGLR
jgi:putative hydrolase of the HAD superfamily